MGAAHSKGARKSHEDSRGKSISIAFQLFFMPTFSEIPHWAEKSPGSYFSSSVRTLEPERPQVDIQAEMDVGERSAPRISWGCSGKDGNAAYLTRSSSVHYPHAKGDLAGRSLHFTGVHTEAQGSRPTPGPPGGAVSCLAPEMLLLSCSVPDGTTHHRPPRVRVTLLFMLALVRLSVGKA